ncbi:MAG TPA: hypothetical protein VES61_08435 [Gaiellaceae bacterium]|nr:hypothetical protein [Gaiellaceae bacterium]
MLSVLAVGVISVGALGGTYANFTATLVRIASNAFATGTLSGHNLLQGSSASSSFTWTAVQA